MNYLDSISDFFKSPKWVTNLLLGAVCVLIPVVGPMVLLGWHITAQFSSPGRISFSRYPDFDFKHFGLWLQRGLWPILVNLVVSVVLVPVMWILMIVPMSLLAILLPNQSSGRDSDAAAIMSLIFMAVVFVLVSLFIVVLTLILKPLLIRAAITQDFASAFNFGFIKSFIAKTWMEMIISTIFLMVAGMALGLVGLLVFCVGIYLAINVLMFAQWHLDRQLYDLYLARGGQPVPISSKLSDTPPGMPYSG